MYCNEVDHWTLLDNSGNCWKMVAATDEQTGQRIFDTDIWQNLEEQFQNESSSL
jgi:hypothetical protein